MALRNRINDWLSIILKVMAIAAIVIGVVWIGLSIYGNVTTSNGQPKPPEEEKAKYTFVLHATGQELYTDDYKELDPGKYQLEGYYELLDNKWEFNDSILLLDSYYFGKIEISTR